MKRHIVVTVPIELRGQVGWPFLVVDTWLGEAVAGFRSGSDAVEESNRRNGEEES